MKYLAENRAMHKTTHGCTYMNLYYIYAQCRNVHIHVYMYLYKYIYTEILLREIIFSVRVGLKFPERHFYISN